MNNLSKVKLLDVNFDAVYFYQMINQIKQCAKQEKKTFIVTANPEILVYAKEHVSYKKILRKADYIVADGIGVVFASKLKKQTIPERITGFDLMNAALVAANEERQSVYFYGAKPETNKLLIKKIRDKYPNLIIAGAKHGYLKDETNVVKEIKMSKPDYVFVALGVPLQEEWIATNIDSLDKGILMGVGGSFDILCGNLQRAPSLFIRLNLEWLYRIIQEPIRFKRLTSIYKFIYFLFFSKKNE